MRSSVYAAGFLIPEPKMPPWWKWYYYLDPGESRSTIPAAYCCTIQSVHLLQVGDALVHGYAEVMDIDWNALACVPL